MFKIVTRIIAALALGLVVSMWILQNTASVKKQVYTTIIQTLQKEWNARIDVESFKINFFTCSIFFKEGKIVPINKKNYAWQFEQGFVHVSPFQLLLNKRISLDIILNNVKAYTTYYNKQSDLIDHMQDIFKARNTGMPIGANSVAINNIDLAVKLINQAETKTDTSPILFLHAPGTIAFNKQAPKSTNSWLGSVALSNAFARYNKKTIFYNFTGNSSLQKNALSNAWHNTTTATLKSAVLDAEKTYTCNAIWNQEQGSLSLADQAGDMALTGSLQQHVHLKGTVPLSVLNNCITFMGSNLDMKAPAMQWATQGSCQVDITIDPSSTTLEPTGSVVLSNLTIATFPIQQIALQLASGKTHSIASKIIIAQSSQAQISGNVYWNWDTAGGSLTLTNTDAIALPQKGSVPTNLSVLPHDLKLAVTFGKKTDTQGTYLCILTNAKTEKTLTYKGAFLFKNNALGIKGKTAHGLYALDAALSPQPHLKNICYTVRNRPLIDLRTTAPYTIAGTIRWSYLRSFLDQSLQRLVFNDNCVLTATLNQQDITRPSGSFRLTQGTFFIPDFHNLIQNVACEWQADTTEKKVTVDNIVIGMSKGTIACPHATATWDDNFNLSMLHAPLTIQNTFVNWMRDFYGIAYGNLLLNKLPDSTAKLSGILVLKKSLLKDTFFNKEATQNFYGPLGGMTSVNQLPIGLHIKLITEKPVTAKTPAINAAATLDLTINNIVGKDFYSAPYLTGSISLDDGYLKFFHNKLKIERGKIQFVANHINDPLVDLIAKNRINKYLINLQVTGSLQKPTILLESTPELTEEQIIALLLSGSENTSLQADLPAMLLQNLDSFIFRSNKNSKHAGLFDKISKTFKYIQITPNITDGADAGKLKGSISVNLNDQLRAQFQKTIDFQKDFSAKDFSAQIEYMLSDDINLKVIKDQRGELGSEVEMRFKLG